VAEVEEQVAALGSGRWSSIRGIRKRASWGLGDIPFYDVAVGPDLARGELRGHATGVIAIGDLAAGLVSFGGLSIGVLSAVGGFAIGGLALGGAAVGGVAVGGGAAGYYACGGDAAGTHVVDAIRRDPRPRASSPSTASRRSASLDVGTWNAETRFAMPIKSKAQRRKFAELLVQGKITPETFEEWNRAAGSADLPERLHPKKPKRKVKSKRAPKAKTARTKKRGRPARKRR
jgi:hypothetical protein